MPHVTKIGLNRAEMSRELVQSEALMDDIELTDVGSVSHDSRQRIRSAYITPTESLGQVLMPKSHKGALKVGKEKLQGHYPEMLLNKLGQRLAFERAGIRLYEALIFKCVAMPDEISSKIVSVDKLRQFRDEEAEHFLLIKATIESLGVEPSLLTLDADASFLATLGIPKVITEPRTTILQCLEAVQTAELTNNAAWEVLYALCSSMGLTEIASDFKHTLQHEKYHVETISEWIRQMILLKGGVVE